MTNFWLVVTIINLISWSLNQMKRPYKSKTKSWIYSFVSSLIDLAQGLIGVVTLGLVTPEWYMKLALWANKRKIMEAINAKSEIPRKMQKD
jgi:uncharacterized membrane protein YjgN (DUF898 family)